MTKPPTIRDVAESAGVSIAAVSRVLNDGPVSSAARARVLTAIAELDYTPRTAARELRTQPQSTIGLVLADVTNPFFAQLADRVVWESRSRGVQVILMTTREDSRLEEEALDTLASRRVTGVIATPTSMNATGWARLADLNTRLVFVDRVVPEVHADAVSIDNEGIAFTATEHLLDLGHRRIGFIAGPETSSTGRERVAGYRRALETRGAAFVPELVRYVPFRGDQGSDAVGALLGLEDPITGLVVANTAQGVSSVRRLKMSGIDIPSRLSVVVFGDDPWTELFTPPLTVARQPVAMLASHSVDLALRPAGAPTSVSVDAEFVVRSSTAPLA